MAMTKQLFLNTLLAIAAISFFSCTKCDDNPQCISSNKSQVITVDGPATGNVNQPLNFTVRFPVINGCGQFQKIEETQLGNTINIILFEQYTGCVCTMDVPVRQKEYTFSANVTGTYILNFRQSDSTNISKTVVIN